MRPCVTFIFPTLINKSEQYDDSTRRSYGKLFPLIFPGMAEVLEYMYKVIR
jgi:hypothetical protein